jgi:hypothetical protein
MWFVSELLNMKIVKQFDDEIYKIDYYGANGTWTWGLGEDGNLYIRRLPIRKGYKEWMLSTDLAIPIDLQTMKRIVKAFGHLVVFT